MQRVAEKAREALEFDKTSAYMFFEEKLPELKEEFGMTEYVEANQQAGDLVFVPSGWFRVSLSLADSISYYETVMADPSIIKAVTDQAVWRPQFGVFQLGLCYGPDGLDGLPNIPASRKQWLKAAVSQVKLEQALEARMPEAKVRSLTACTPEAWT